MAATAFGLLGVWGKSADRTTAPERRFRQVESRIADRRSDIMAGARRPCPEMREGEGRPNFQVRTLRRYFSVIVWPSWPCDRKPTSRPCPWRA
jgi:hypothetical protein